MILENYNQYNQAKKQLTSFEQGLAWLAVVMTNSPAMRQQLRSADGALRQLTEELRAAIQEFQQVAHGGMTTLMLSSLLDLGHALGRARVAANLGLSQLGAAAMMSAERLGRVEAGLDNNLRLLDADAIVQALGLRLRIEIFAPNPPAAGGDEVAS